MALLLTIESRQEFSPQEVCASSQYLAVKILEKKTSEILINRMVFEQILSESEATSEHRVLACSAKALSILSNIKTLDKYAMESPPSRKVTLLKLQARETHNMNDRS